MGNLVTQTFSMSSGVALPNMYLYLKAVAREMGPYLTRDDNLSSNHISSSHICLVASFLFYIARETQTLVHVLRIKGE